MSKKSYSTELVRALIYFLTKKTLEIFNKSSPNKPNAVFIQYQCHYFLTDYPREGVPTRGVHQIKNI